MPVCVSMLLTPSYYCGGWISKVPLWELAMLAFKLVGASKPITTGVLCQAGE